MLVISSMNTVLFLGQHQVENKLYQTSEYYTHTIFQTYIASRGMSR